MKLLIKKGVTSKRIAIFVQNSSVTTGAGLSGLAWNTAGLTWYYWREDEGNAGGTAVTLATMTRGTWATGGFVEKDATNMPGFYEIGIPDAALATGAGWVVMVLRGATNMAPVTLEIQLVDFDPQDAVRLGLTSLPNAAADAAGGLPISDAGGLDLDTQLGRLDAAISTRSSHGDPDPSGFIDAAISSRATPAQVNAEMVDALNVDTYPEPGQEAPPATTTLVKKIGYLYKLLRNRVTSTATEIKVYNDDAVTVDQKATHSDDGATYDRGELGTGP